MAFLTARGPEAKGLLLGLWPGGRVIRIFLSNGYGLWLCWGATIKWHHIQPYSDSACAMKTINKETTIKQILLVLFSYSRKLLITSRPQFSLGCSLIDHRRTPYRGQTLAVKARAADKFFHSFGKLSFDII